MSHHVGNNKEKTDAKYLPNADTAVKVTDPHHLQDRDEADLPML